MHQISTRSTIERIRTNGVIQGNSHRHIRWKRIHLIGINVKEVCRVSIREIKGRLIRWDNRRKEGRGLRLLYIVRNINNPRLKIKPQILE